MIRRALLALSEPRALLSLAATALLLIVAAFSLPARADGTKPVATVQTVPLDGLYIDESAPQRYCVIERGRFGDYGEQTFLWCALGWGNGGSSMVQVAGSWVGVELPLLRLQADNGLLVPVQYASVTVTAITLDTITVRYGSPGAQTPAYTLTRQPRPPEPLPYIGIEAPWDWPG